MRITRLLILTAALMIPMFLAACNTVEGAGQDIGAAGKGITNGAADVQKKL